MKIKISEVKNFLEKAVAKVVTKEEAKYFALEQIENHLKDFPRTFPLREAIGDIDAWNKNSKSKIKIVVDKGASLVLDFNKLSVSPKIKYIHDEMEKRAKKYGISMIGIKNSHGIHDLNLWTDGLAKRNLLGLCFFNGGPDSVVPYGGTKGIFGTNPLSYAIPTGEKPIAVDMATSEAPYFEIRNAKKNNLKLRNGIAVDSNGVETTDATKGLSDDGIANLLPMGGGYKGYVLVLLVEILTGSLIGSPLSTEMSPGYVNEEHGGLLIAIDIASFTKVATFKKSVDQMNNITRTQKASPLVEKITIPGDRSYERMEKLLKSGNIEIPDDLLEKLKKLA